MSSSLFIYMGLPNSDVGYKVALTSTYSVILKVKEDRQIVDKGLKRTLRKC